MSADNRSTHTDALATLGTIINSNEKRDAIHLGVEPIQAGCQLKRGDHVGIGPFGKAYSVKFHEIKPVGIVDPFLTNDVEEGEWFWLIVYPRQITSLRHVWEHPDFKDSHETGGKELMQITDHLKEQFVHITATEEQIHKAKLLINDPIAQAKQRLMDWADQYDLSYEDVIEHAASHVQGGSYWVHEEDGGKFEGESTYDGFWEDYKKVSGEDINPTKYHNFLSCSC